MREKVRRGRAPSCGNKAYHFDEDSSDVVLAASAVEHGPEGLLEALGE
jgi:hypothetical protein